MRLDQRQLEMLQMSVNDLMQASEIVNVHLELLKKTGVAIHHLNTAHLLLNCALADYQMSLVSRVVFND